MKKKIEFYCSAREERKIIIDSGIKTEGFQYMHSNIYIPEYNFRFSFFLHRICNLIPDLQEKNIKKKEDISLPFETQDFP